MIKEVLGGISKESNFIDSLPVLYDGFDDLNVMSITLPGHQG